MSGSTPTTIDEGVKSYLLEVSLAPILERFVGECVQNRPSDIFAFMADFARRHQPGATNSDDEHEVAASTTGEEWSIQRAWRECYPTEAEQTKLGEQFFSLLFIQQPTMKRTVFAQAAAELPAAGQLLGFMFGRRVLGDLSTQDMAQFAAGHWDTSIEGYHFQALVSTGLIALQSTMTPEVWTQTGAMWREFCMEIGSEAEVVLAEVKKQHNTHENSPADASLAAPGTEQTSVKASWESLIQEDKDRIVTETFNLLFMQHAPVKRNFFENVNIEELVPSLVLLLGKVAEGNLSDEDVIGSGVVEKGVSLGVQPYHITYGVTALLMALSVVLGASLWNGKLASEWTHAAGTVGRRVEALMEAAEAKAE